MMTLKVAWAYTRSDGFPSDEATIYVEADRVTVHRAATPDEAVEIIQTWSDADALDRIEDARSARVDEEGVYVYQVGRLVRVDLDGRSRWLICSRAWLLGHDGRTIERVV